MEKGLTLQQLAEMTGLTRKTLGFLERGEREPHPGNIVKLAEALGCSTSELMEPEEQ